ncbi:MAG: hypothetical protein JSR77_15730 [Planctomycetes bacterium]|nr:hypothetical protein [Planctomycetota bacterium]
MLRHNLKTRFLRPGRVAFASLVYGLPLAAGTLLSASYMVFGALPPVPVPVENPITEQKRVLGKILFWDEQMSSSNVVSCGTCHVPGRGGADDRLARNPGIDGVINTPDDIQGSPGIIKSDTDNDYQRDTVFALNPQITGRAANVNINAAFAPALFWDGGATGQFRDPQTGQIAIANGGALESQSVAPLLNNVEMAHAGYDWNAIVTKLNRVNPLDLATTLPADVAAVLASHPDYPELFRQAFGDSNISARRIAFAIATYERTLIADRTPYDRFIAGDTTALTPGQQQGLQAMTASNCRACHAGDLFTDQTFRNIGLRPVAEDTGRQVVTGNPANRGQFKVPSLRNVGLKRTFMHNGQFTSIPQVLGFYARAPGSPPQNPDNQDPIMRNVNVPPQAAQVIGDFLANGLTDPRVRDQTFPFDHPTLFVNRPGNQITIVGGGSSGSGGIVPRLIAQAPPMIGNLNFRIGLDGAVTGASARLGISFTPPVNGRITPVRFLDAVIAEPATVGATGAGQGIATSHWPILDGDFTNGQVVFAQWFVTDAGAAGGEATSPVARIPFFCGSYGCQPSCPADTNRDGGVDGDDVQTFFTNWAMGDAAGDFNADGGIDGSDVQVFFSLWEQGC